MALQAAVVGLDVLSGLSDSTMTDAVKRVKDGLYKVKVVETDAKALQKELEDFKFKKWNEKVEVMQASGIEMKNITQFMDHLVESYAGIDESLRKKMNAIRWADEWDYKIVEFKYNDEDGGGAKYGMIAFGKSNDKKSVDCMYVCYVMDFSIADTERITVKQHSALWGLFKWQTSEREVVKAKLGIIDIKRIKNFLRIKALQGFYKEGLIERINYVKDITDVPDE